VIGVFEKGNVGVLEGFNIVAFRKLEIRPSASITLPDAAGALGKDVKALGKSFAESPTRQRALGEAGVGKGYFAESFSSGSRQIVYREPKGTLGKEKWSSRRATVDGSFAKCHRQALGKGPSQRPPWSPSLPRAQSRALGKEGIQSCAVLPLCRELLEAALGKSYFFLQQVYPLNVWSIDNWITAMMEHVPQLRPEKVKDTKGRVIKVHS
jgi:hypothetical protein